MQSCKVITKIFFSIIAVFVIATAAFAQYVTPHYVGYVNDFAHVLTQENSAKISSVITDLKNKTGAEIAVVTLSSLEGYPIEDVGLAIGRDWGVGQKGKDNGVVIVVAPREHKMRIEVGYGLEGALTDAHAGRIRDEYMLPYFRKGDYNTGIFNGTYAVAQTIVKANGANLDSNYQLPKAAASDDSTPVPFAILFVLVYLLAKLLYFIFPPNPATLKGTGRTGVGGIYIGDIGGGFGSGGGFGGFGGGGFGGGGCSGGW